VEMLLAISPEARYNLGLLLLVVAMVGVCIWAYRVWSEINEQEEPATPEELLEAFEEARATGKLDDAEFARVRARIQDAGAQPPAKKAQESGPPDVHAPPG
jgi:hypothetical protein